MLLPNLRKALYCRLVYKNQSGTVREEQPTSPTYNNTPFDPEELVDLGAVSLTRLEHAKRLGGPDVWTPHLKITFPASNELELKGEVALKVWDAWKAVVFGTKQ